MISFNVTLPYSSFNPRRHVCLRGGEVNQRSGPWHEVIIRVFCIYSSLKGVAPQRDFFLAQGNLLSCCNLVTKQCSSWKWALQSLADAYVLGYNLNSYYTDHFQTGLSLLPPPPFWGDWLSSEFKRVALATPSGWEICAIFPLWETRSIQKAWEFPYYPEPCWPCTVTPSQLCESPNPYFKKCLILEAGLRLKFLTHQLSRSPTWFQGTLCPRQAPVPSFLQCVLGWLKLASFSEAPAISWDPETKTSLVFFLISKGSGTQFLHNLKVLSGVQHFHSVTWCCHLQSSSLRTPQQC